MPDPKTIRVRILVAVDRKGEWASRGYSNCGDAETRADIYIDDLETGERYTWVEADVPMPDADVVQGVVSKGDE